MAKRKRTVSATFLASYYPSWFYPAWGLISLSAISAAYGLTVFAHLNGWLMALLAYFACVLLPVVVGVKPKPADITIGASGVQMDGELRVRPPLIATRTDLRGKVMISIVGTGGRVRLTDVSEDEVPSILRAANPFKSTLFASVRVGPQTRWASNVPVALMIVGTVLGRSATGSKLVVPGVVVFGVILLFVWAWWIRVTLRVDRHGVALTSGPDRKFFPIATLASSVVIMEGGVAEGLELVLRDGSIEKIVLRSLPSKTWKRDEPARGASEAIQKAIARLGATAPSPDLR